MQSSRPQAQALERASSGFVTASVYSHALGRAVALALLIERYESLWLTLPALVIIGRDGKVVARFKTGVQPDDPQVVEAIKKELAKKS